METPNLNYIEQLSGGDATFEKKLLSVFKMEFPQEIAIYNENISNKAYLKAAGNVHKLKHKFGILGLEKGYQIAVDYEENLKIESFTLQEEFEEILNKITQFLKEL